MKRETYSDDNAMDYEYLLRRAHQCSRYGVAGANADDFRNLMRKASDFQIALQKLEQENKQLFPESLVKIQVAYAVKSGIISGYLKTAIQKVMKDFDEQLSDEQYEEFEGLNTMLSEPTLQVLNEVVARSQKVMIELGLFPK